jgi:hypothetical protein
MYSVARILVCFVGRHDAMPSLLLVSTTVKPVLHTRIHIHTIHRYILCIPSAIILHVHTQCKHKHPRGYRHATPRPIDNPSLEYLLPSIHFPPWPFPIYHVTVPSREASVPVNGPYGSVLLLGSSYLRVPKAFLFPIGVLSKLPVLLYFGMSPRCPVGSSVIGVT